MNFCEESLSDAAESDSSLESEAQDYIDSDKADTDVENELYSQIYYLDDLHASSSGKSFLGDSSCIEISPIKNTGSFHPVKSEEESTHSAKKDTPGLVSFIHFGNSTPKDPLTHALTTGNKKNVNTLQKSSKAKVKKKKTVASISAAKPSKSSGGAVFSCSSNDGGDSDDVSIVWLDSDEQGDSSSILLNINGERIPSADMILLDSTATSDDSCGRNSVSPDATNHEESLNISLSTRPSVSNQSADVWQIDHEDRFASVKKPYRYHNKRSSICNNCKKRGHLSRDCMEPRNTKCYLCGYDHVWSKCQQMMCGTCFEYSHVYHKCRYKACDITCSLCKMKGHYTTECPDIWRRYHLSTSEAIVKGSKEIVDGQIKYCYNCGHQGHYGHECLKPRLLPDTFPTWPFVISYKRPSQQLKKYLKNADKGESSTSDRHDSHPRHRHNKKHRSRADELREMISTFKEPYENSKDSRSKQKNRKQFKRDKYSPSFKGNNFHRVPMVIKLDEDSSKSKKRKKRDSDRLYAFKRKKQKLNATL